MQSAKFATTPAEFDLPSYAQITFNGLDRPFDELRSNGLVLRVELLHSIGIDCTWDWGSAGYWISARQFGENGSTEELALRFSSDKRALVRAVEMLSRQLS